MYLLRTD